MPCCLCPDGACPPNCPLLEVFPVESPFKTRQELIDTGFNLEFIKKCLLQANTPDEQKLIVEGMVISCEARRKYPFEGEAGLEREYHQSLVKKERLMKKLYFLKDNFQELTENETQKHVAASGDLTEAGVSLDAVGKGFPGLSKCTTGFDGTSSKD